MANSNGKADGVDWNDPVSSLSPAARAVNDLCETNGRRQNKHKVFHLSLTGEDLHDLMELLRNLAVGCEVYQTVCRAVVAERNLYEQAREQGF